MEGLNLVEILKDCPRDYKLYSPVFGNVRLLEVFTDCENPSFVIATGYPPMAMVHLSPNGKLTRAGECIVFPSKDQRDWSKFKNTQFKPLLRPSDLPLDALAIQFELVEPKKVYWFKSGEDKYENDALLNQLTEITGISDHCPIMNNHIVFSCGEYIDCASPGNNLARTAMMFGVELKMK